MRSSNCLILPVVISAVLVIIHNDCWARNGNGQPARPPGGIGNSGDKKLSYRGPAVLDPWNFFGESASSYAAAKAIPEVLSKLFCYCGCDVSDKHSRLIDCFTSKHGDTCRICQQEAVLALKLKRGGAPMMDIQKQVDETFSRRYPFTQDTPIYKKYKASRLWKSGTAQGTVDHSLLSGSSPSTGAPKVKPGAKVGNCCGHEAHKK